VFHLVNGIPQTTGRVSPRVRAGRSAFGIMLCVCTVFMAGCTLTGDDFQPQPAPAPQAQPSSDSEAGQQSTGPLAAEPMSGVGCSDPRGCCQADADCASGGVCRDGICATASCLDGEDVGMCQLETCLGPGCPDAAGGQTARCDDHLRDGTESDVDCGRDCPVRCPLASACREDADCASESCAGNLCLPATCSDGITNQDETDRDCGGSCPSGCAVGGSCELDADCETGLDCGALTQQCFANSCSDGRQGGSEILADCGGGACPGCPAGTTCNSGADCLSKVCVDGACATPSCRDAERNGGETDTDCGGSSSGCERCLASAGCLVDEDCGSGACVSGSCAGSRCDDNQKNGTETGIDCGGTDAACPACPDASGCGLGSDCESGNCLGGVCISCQDNLRNGSETDVDCGGACAPCAASLQCGSDADCASGACEGGRCCGGNQGDCTRCAERLSPSIDCDLPQAGVDSTGVGNCQRFLVCLTNNPAVCSTRNASGCSGDNQAVDACPHNDYGGNAGTGLTRANQVLQNAGCLL
jgi:hypothetical protein